MKETRFKLSKEVKHNLRSLMTESIVKPPHNSNNSNNNRWTTEVLVKCVYGHFWAPSQPAGPPGGRPHTHALSPLSVCTAVAERTLWKCVGGKRKNLCSAKEMKPVHYKGREGESTKGRSKRAVTGEWRVSAVQSVVVASDGTRAADKRRRGS